MLEINVTPIGDYTICRPVGELDAFRDENIAYAQRLAQASVSVELHVHPGVPHAFEALAPQVAVAQRSVADRLRALTSF